MEKKLRDNDCLVVIYKINNNNNNNTCNMHRLTKSEKISEKQPVFKDKSDDNKKVVIVRRKLM